MSLDQFLFQKIASRFRSAFSARRELEVEGKRVRLEDIQGPLTVLAKALTGEAIEIAPAEEEGGWRDTIFYLPADFSLGRDLEENRQYYLFRVVYLATQKAMELNAGSHETLSVVVARQKAEQNSSAVLGRLLVEYPQLVELWGRLRDSLQGHPHYLWGRWMSSKAKKDEKSSHPSPSAKHSVQTEVPAKPREEVEVIEPDLKAIEDYTLGHNFEKVETLEEFKGNWRDLDGEDDLEAHAEAIQELDLRQVIRLDRPTHSVLQADFLSNGTLTESKDAPLGGAYGIYHYDEWDGRKRRYRPGYCRVYPGRSEVVDTEFRKRVIDRLGSTLRQLRRQMGSLWTESEWLKRQSDGPEIDIGAVVENVADRKSVV